MNAQEIQDTLRTLKRPTVIERLKKDLPFPRGSVPKNGLPLWEQMPLDTKLPIIDHPRGAFVLYRDKVGKKLWRQSPSNAFRLDDPFCLDVSYDYDPLHDANLAHIFKSRSRRKVLRRQGLISKRGEAVCSLSQFNNYRRYLQCIYRDNLRLEYERMVGDQTDQIALDRAQESAEKALQIATIREERDADSLAARRGLEELEKQRIARIRKRQKYFDERIANLRRQKVKARKQRIAESRVYGARVRYRQAVAEEIRRARVAAVRQMWRLTDVERTRRLTEQQANLKALKEKEINDRWQEKREFQQQRLERDKALLQQAEEERRLAVELRMTKMEAEHLRMQVLFNKVRLALCKEREEARKNNNFKYIPRNCDEESLAVRGVSSSSRQNSRKATHRRPQSVSRFDDDEEPEYVQYRRKVALCIQAMEDAATKKPRPFDLWNIIRHNEGANDDEDGSAGKENDTVVQVGTAVDALLSNVVQGYIHHRVMHSLKEVYHDALDRCRWLVEREERRQAAQYGWVCHHALQQDKGLTGSVKKMGYNPCCALCCPRAPKKKAQFNPEKMMRKIAAVKRRVDRYRAMLEEGSDSASESDEEEKYVDEEEETDGGRLDKNFEDFSTHLRRRMIVLASQSVDERFRKFTAHRWKLLKEVELSELMERLCNMMMLYDSKEFIQSAEFQWAADILARDVMKEVRAQIRSEKHNAAIQRREEHVKGTRKIFRSRHPARKSMKFDPLPVAKDTGASDVCFDLQELAPEDVPLLRLHSRSPHQPSLPSIVADDV